jgi:hypothetical protein
MLIPLPKDVKAHAPIPHGLAIHLPTFVLRYVHKRTINTRNSATVRQPAQETDSQTSKTAENAIQPAAVLLLPCTVTRTPGVASFQQTVQQAISLIT